jgi:aminomethyltransferase
MSDLLAKTPLHAWHAEHGGRMVDFAGWSMPVQYRSIVDEHRATRTAAGVFDISHMGRLRFEGPDAAALLDRLVTRRVTDLPVGGIRYALMTNEQGGILDDVLVYHLETPGGRPYHLLVVNAANRQKILAWIRQQWPAGGDVALDDLTQATAMIAVQGPLAEQIVAPLVMAKVAELGYYHGLVAQHLGQPCTVSRTGYTGEDGFELIVRAEDAVELWRSLFRTAGERGVLAAGLGARDTLRLEAGMPLYGHELTEQIHPYQAGLGFAVNLKDRNFVGREALMRYKQAPGPLQRVGLVMSGRRVAREGCPVYRSEQSVGEITSGTFSPTLQKSIAMAYVLNEASEVGGGLDVEIRGRREAAEVVALPFYQRSRP